MRVKKVIGIGLFCIAIFCFNYALIFGYRRNSNSQTSRLQNASHPRKDQHINITAESRPTSVASKFRESVNTPQIRLPTTKQPQACNGILLKGALRIDLIELEQAYWNALDWDSPVGRNETFLGNFTEEDPANFETVYLGQPDCTPDQTVAIIIPFRDRESHLKILLGHLIPILKRQGPRFSIFVVEQVGKGPFNKGRVMNTGFNYAIAAGVKSGTPFDCFVFHDVDMLMENDKLIHKCSGEGYINHLSIAIDKFHYVPMCCGLTVGGVLAFTTEQFKQVNGFPNTFWGWGGEDDAINDRIVAKQLRIVRPDAITGRYTMIKHTRDEFNPPNPQRWKAIKEARKRIDFDGLADLHTAIVKVEKFRYFTRVYVDVRINGTANG